MEVFDVSITTTNIISCSHAPVGAVKLRFSFQEKPQVGQGWINGGFFIIEPEFFSLIEGDQTILEREPLEKAAQIGELMAFKHEGFWQPMDTKRDKDYLDRLWESGTAPWKVSAD